MPRMRAWFVLESSHLKWTSSDVCDVWHVAKRYLLKREIIFLDLKQPGSELGHNLPSSATVSNCGVLGRLSVSRRDKRRVLARVTTIFIGLNG